MKQKLNEPLTFRSAAAIVSFSIIVVLLSGAVAKACGSLTALGCDVNCTVQIVNDCSDPVNFHCVVRTCETINCNICPGGECGNRGCDGRIVDKPCGACISVRVNGC